MEEKSDEGPHEGLVVAQRGSLERVLFVRLLFVLAGTQVEHLLGRQVHEDTLQHSHGVEGHRRGGGSILHTAGNQIKGEIFG
jgi:hypothetical protein